jgi:hypothetical protein
MRITSITGNGLSSMEVRLFNQIVTFSVTGLAMSMFLVVCGFRIINPWF